MTSRSGKKSQRSFLYRSLASYLREIFGKTVRKVPVDPGYGCPNRNGEISDDGCAFCNPESFVPLRARSGTDPVTQAMQARKGRETEPFIVYMQAGTCTYADADLFREVVDALCNLPGAVGLFVGTRPDYVDEDILKVLGSWLYKKLVWLELGLQSSRDQTLELVNRGHDIAAFTSARELAARFSIPVLAHVILGLPGEGTREFSDTARYLADLNVEGVKIHHLQVIRGTRMEKMFEEGQVVPLDWETYPDIVAGFLELLPPTTVIHRLLADAEDEILVAPRWPAREMVLRAVRDHMMDGGRWQGRLYPLKNRGTIT